MDGDLGLVRLPGSATAGSIPARRPGEVRASGCCVRVLQTLTLGG
jgi:hypothetical protein